VAEEETKVYALSPGPFLESAAGDIARWQVLILVER
jgi:hypothetical protein